MCQRMLVMLKGAGDKGAKGAKGDKGDRGAKGWGMGSARTSALLMRL
jgi:hypothetical protein